MTGKVVVGWCGLCTNQASYVVGQRRFIGEAADRHTKCGRETNALYLLPSNCPPLCPQIKWFTFTVAVKVILGFDNSWISPEEFRAVYRHFEDLVNGLFTVPLNLPGLPYRRGLKARKVLMRMIEKSLQRVRASRWGLTRVR